MKVSLKWLREYVDVTLSVQDLAAKLTASGTEVAGITRTGGTWDRLQVTQIVRIERHPNADRLQLASVNLGAAETTVVCGAPNIQVGQKVPYAPVGATLIDGHTGDRTELKAASIRGVVSQGMICSEKELGLSEDHQGILILPEDAPIGAPLADYLGDTILDLDITPNRPDCYSVLGIAREVAALTGQQVREPGLRYEETGPAAIHDRISVEVHDPDLCPRYTASLVTGVKLGPSPGWMQERLQAAGMRSINNVVDITNYVMLEVGQPLHAFDFQRLRDRRITVRRARPDEEMTTLDGIERRFGESTLLICDGSGPVGIGGIIGGAESEVSEQTPDVLLEAANFNPMNIRQSETALHVRTEASLRFDKGLHPDSAAIGLRRATKLLVELCGGAAAQGIIDVYPTPRELTVIHLTQHRLTTVLGTEISGSQVSSILIALGCHVEGEWTPGFRVTPPWWRPDLRIPEDLAEEVARVIGYDALPTASIGGAVPHMAPNPLRDLKDNVRDLLVAGGMQEVITYSLTSLTNAQIDSLQTGTVEVQPIKVANPMSTEQEYLRTSLRPSLLATLAANERHSPGSLQLFEVGRTYLPRQGDLPEERDMVAGVISGMAQESHWGQTSEPISFYDAKGILETLFHHLGITAAFRTTTDSNLHPGRTAEIVAQGQPIGVLGELHPETAARFDIASRPVYLFELDLLSLLPHSGSSRQYRPLSRFPAVTEDLALVVEALMPASEVERTIRETPSVTHAHLFDVYTGPQVAPGKKSLAYAITYEARDHTMSGEEVAAVRQEILGRLRTEHAATLRE